MNKQEIEHQIKRYETVRECAEEHLNELNIQLRDLCEAEKPKLRHGDFWWNEADDDINVFLEELNDDHRDCMATPDDLITNIGSNYKGQPILGNIFKMMEGWGEPFEEFAITGWGCGEIEVKIVSKSSSTCKLIEFRISDNYTATFDISEAEEIWRNLGHALITLKRKQQK